MGRGALACALQQRYSCLWFALCLKIFGVLFDPKPTTKYQLPIAGDEISRLANGQLLSANGWFWCLDALCDPNGGPAMIAWLLAFLGLPPPPWGFPGR
jgi:hypothetical protein